MVDNLLKVLTFRQPPLYNVIRALRAQLLKVKFKQYWCLLNMLVDALVTINMPTAQHGRVQADIRA